jgi:type III secretion system low calcium response chaperone LcrH/SycD
MPKLPADFKLGSGELKGDVKAAVAQLTKRAGDELERSPGTEVRRWARGEATLQELKGYSPEELYQIAQHGYTLFLNGKVQDAQTVFEGLVAVDPRNEYYYRALGVVYHRRGDAERAIRQFTHALTVAPRSPAAFVNRAEVHISRRDFERALADLNEAMRVGRDPGDPIYRKASALRTMLSRRR